MHTPGRRAPTGRSWRALYRLHPLWWPALAAWLLAGCAATPAARYESEAAARGLLARERTGAPFVHRVYAKPGAGVGPLHVYLDGDGRPAASPRLVAADPTPRERVVLDLVAADPGPALVIGRPCYHLTRPDPTCHPALWTTHRYAPEVLASLVAVIDAELAQAPDRPVVLVGYSGGGALAMLLAPRLARLDAVVTIAANLDTEAWTRHHGYAALTGSLNPATAPPLAARIRQLHLAGAADEVVPPALVRAGLRRQPAAELRVLEGFDHACCWARAWPGILAELRTRRAVRPRRREWRDPRSRRAPGSARSPGPAR